MFNWFKPKLVQYGDGSFVVQRNDWWLCWTETLYFTDFGQWSHNIKQAKFKTGDEALENYEKHVMAEQFKVIAVLDNDEWDL